MAASWGASVKMMVSYGGEIRRCPDSGKARYAGGDNRIVQVGMSERLGDLRARLAALAGHSDIRVRYAVAADGLDALRDVESEADLWTLVTLLYCCSADVAVAAGCSRVRAFLFSVADSEEVVFAPVRDQESVSTPSMLWAESRANKAWSRISGEPSAGLAPPATASTADSAGTLRASGSSSATTSGDGTQAESGFETLAATAVEQSTKIKLPSTSGGAGAGQAGNGFKALPAFPAPAVLFVPVALRLAVFYPVIQFYLHMCCPS